MSRQKSIVTVFVLALSSAALWATQTETKLDDRAIRAYLDQIHAQWGMMNVPRADGEFLHDFIVEHGYRRGLEIGTANGYSAIWMGMALRKTGGKLITIEINSRRVALARQNFARVGLHDVIELRHGDALEIIPQLQGPFDFVFIDAWKEDYVKYFQLVYPKVQRGGAILAHNVLSRSRGIEDFLEAIQNHPHLETRIERRSRAGISVSLKH